MSSSIQTPRVGILEDFYAKHPDFGRGGFFAVLPQMPCASAGQLTEPTVPDQVPIVPQKLTWLLDNGYEIGNHTYEHQSLLDVDNDFFKRQIGEAIVAFQAMVPEIQGDILNMPFGEYPDSTKHPQQWQWLRDGFEYQGKQIKIIGAVTVGNQPSYAPVSTNWDPMFVYRIATCDCPGGITTWFPNSKRSPNSFTQATAIPTRSPSHPRLLATWPVRLTIRKRRAKRSFGIDLAHLHD